MISAKIVADSINESGGRITTMLLTFPRIILSEFNTHRAFSRNTASSRAIPFEKMVKSVEENPFIPIAWQKQHKGMQGNEYYETIVAIDQCQTNWLNARDSALIYAQMLYNKAGATKQLANRLLEPFSYVTVLCTATEWENFFELRCPSYEIYSGAGMLKKYRSKKDAIFANPDLNESGIYAKPMSNLDWLQINKGQAEIHMMALAEAMWDAYNESIPKKLEIGEWHIPYSGHSIGDDFDKSVAEYYGKEWKQSEDKWSLPCDTWQQYELFKVKVSTVRCARTSYTVVGEDQKQLTYQRMIELHDQLINAIPVHASPTEHCAQNIGINERSRNFTGGWKQYRDILGI